MKKEQLQDIENLEKAVAREFTKAWVGMMAVFLIGAGVLLYLCFLNNQPHFQPKASCETSSGGTGLSGNVANLSLMARF